MIFSETIFSGVYLIKLEKREDERGFLARTWCQKEYELHGLQSNIAQANMTYNKLKGTLRGLHYQKKPYEESKSVRCFKGAIYDVVIDLRSDSKTYLQWTAFHISASNFNALYIPSGFAHGYQTLENDSLVFYQNSEFFSPNSEFGIRYNDPFFKISWPNTITSISPKDQLWLDFVAD